MVEPRFLVLRLGSLGDIVHTFPAAAGLRDSFPRAEITWLTHPRWVSLVESSALASEVWPVESRSLASVNEVVHRLRQAHWDAALDYQGLWKTALLPLLGGVKRRIGFSSATIREFGVPLLYTDRVRCTTVHIADQNGELSLRAGAHRGTGNFTLRVSSADEVEMAGFLRGAGLDRYIVLSPGGGWRSKCWPPDRFGELCRRIRQSPGLRCVVNYGPGEDDLADAVRTASADAAPLLYNGELGPLMALLRNALCIVGGDTGPLHLAIALGTPAVALFGPTDPARNGPYPRRVPSSATAHEDIVLRAPHSVTSHRRGDAPDPSMLAIEVGAVLDAVRRRIGTHI
ncbi:MAG: glycosyltransferase family 9 protein [Candidatus Acidiferrales bacterium]